MTDPGTRSRVNAALQRILTDPVEFSGVVWPRYKLRRYQQPFVRQVAADVAAGHGGLSAAVFSRQAGKDEALAQLLCYIAARHRVRGGEIVVGLPTLRPQGVIALRRIQDRLDNPLTGPFVEREGATIVRVGSCRIHYVSAATTANARGHTASLLLVANESQDIDPDHWDAVFAPMAASTNAHTLMMGTVWTSDTLLARTMRLTRTTGKLHKVTWRQVAAELPAYGDYVRAQIEALGAQHPYIRTEYELEELDAEGRLFPPERLQLLSGSFPLLHHRTPGETYALCVDVAGADESVLEGEAVINPHRRDSTAVAVYRVIPGEVDGKPHARYELVHRYEWIGVKQSELHTRIVRLAADVWRARKVVVDATGIGAGLASFLTQSLGEDVVIPFVFSAASKSRLGWDFVGLIESGRVQVGDPGDSTDTRSVRQRELDERFWYQTQAVRYSVRPGPNRLMSWEAPADVHDDLTISAALIAAPDIQTIDWRPRTARGR